MDFKEFSKEIMGIDLSPMMDKNMLRVEYDERCSGIISNKKMYSLLAMTLSVYQCINYTNTSILIVADSKDDFLVKLNDVCSQTEKYMKHRSYNLNNYTWIKFSNGSYIEVCNKNEIWNLLDNDVYSYIIFESEIDIHGYYIYRKFAGQCIRRISLSGSESDSFVKKVIDSYDMYLSKKNKIENTTNTILEAFNKKKQKTTFFPKKTYERQLPSFDNYAKTCADDFKSFMSKDELKTIPKYDLPRVDASGKIVFSIESSWRFSRTLFEFAVWYAKRNPRTKIKIIIPEIIKKDFHLKTFPLSKFGPTDVTAVVCNITSEFTRYNFTNGSEVLLTINDDEDADITFFVTVNGINLEEKNHECSERFNVSVVFNALK